MVSRWYNYVYVYNSITSNTVWVTHHTSCLHHTPHMGKGTWLNPFQVHKSYADFLVPDFPETQVSLTIKWRLAPSLDTASWRVPSGFFPKRRCKQHICFLCYHQVIYNKQATYGPVTIVYIIPPEMCTDNYRYATQTVCENLIVIEGNTWSRRCRWSRTVWIDNWYKCVNLYFALNPNSYKRRALTVKIHLIIFPDHVLFDQLISFE